jgi:hypothetical protein
MARHAGNPLVRGSLVVVPGWERLKALCLRPGAATALDGGKLWGWENWIKSPKIPVADNPFSQDLSGQGVR